MPGTVSDPPTRLSSTWPLGTCPTADGQLWSPGDAGGVRGLGSLWPPSLALGTGFCPISRPLFPIRKTRNLDLFKKNYKISFSTLRKSYAQAGKGLKQPLWLEPPPPPCPSSEARVGARLAETHPENLGPGDLGLQGWGQGGSQGPMWGWLPVTVVTVSHR